VPRLYAHMEAHWLPFYSWMQNSHALNEKADMLHLRSSIASVTLRRRTAVYMLHTQSTRVSGVCWGQGVSIVQRDFYSVYCALHCILFIIILLIPTTTGYCCECRNVKTDETFAIWLSTLCLSSFITPEGSKCITQWKNTQRNLRQ